MGGVATVHILGPVEASGSNGQASLGGAKQRLVLVLLALAEGRLVPADRLVDAIWGERASDGARRTLQVYVSTLRKALAEAGIEGGTLVREGTGYRLALPLEALDHVRFARLLSDGQRLLADDKAEAASTALRDALALWRGPALGDLADDAALSGDAQRLEELRLVCLEELIDADLKLGRHAAVAAELEQLVAEHPLRERLRGQLMLALYRSGRQAEALDVYKASRTALVEELGLEPGREIQTLHSQILNQDPVLSAPDRPAPRANVVRLPTPASSFIGRERELADVTALIEREDARIITLTGPGGTGKTRLAVEAARKVADTFPDGIFWVPLAPLRDPSLLVASIAQALDVNEEASRSLTDTLSDALAEKRALVLLDNVEHLLPDAALELAGLVQIQGTVLLLTSRERIQLQGEDVYPVPTLVEQDGKELFIARARALEPGFQANGSVAELCLRLDGLPLALELAAARTIVFSPEQLLERISQRLDLLKAGRDADPRQQTLRATIEWSYELLLEPEQRLFRAFSAFAGGCTYEAAEEVADADPDTLQSLIDKSLLRRRDADFGPRYWMLETIREYAAERLEVEGGKAVHLAYRRYFQALAEGAEPDLWGGKAEATARIASENENLRAALGAAVADRDAESALRTAVSIYRFWEARSRYGEAREWLSQALALEGGDADLRARALMGIGRAANFQCDWSEAIAALEESVGTFRDLGEPIGISRCLGFLGHAYLFTGDSARAADVLEENLAIARQTADDQTISNALYNLAFAYVERREFSRALDALGDARRISHQLDNRFGVALATIELGNVAVLAGDYEHAAVELQDGLRQAEEMGSPTWLFIARRHSAKLALVEGRTDEAEQLLASLAEIPRDRIPAWEVAHWLNELAAVAAAKEDAPRAALLWGAADAAFESLGLVLLQEDRLLRDRLAPPVREALDDGSWRAAWTEGHEMNATDALAYALEPSLRDVG